jgi:hypothetical protein
MVTTTYLARQPASGDIGSASSATYDWHGVVGVRVLDWRRSDIRGVESQLGLERVRLDRPPDLTVRFVDRLPLMGELTYLASDAAFAGDAFVLTGRGDRRPLMRVPFASLGSDCEILVVRGFSPVPLLVPILNLTALRKGYLPVHASGFVYGDMGVLVTGGARGGKTGTLLAFMSQGATFVGDDWVLVHQDGRAMYGLPTPMQVKAAYLSVLPEYRARLDEGTRRRLRMMGSLLRLERWVPARSSETSVAARARTRIRARLAAGLTARVSPHRLFGEASRLGAGSPDVVFLARSVDSDGVVVNPIRPADLVRRLVPLLEYEWREFDRYYTLFRSAFPTQRNALIEKKTSHLEAGLQFALKDKRTYEVCYRSPAPIREVFRVLEPLISSDGSAIGLRVQGTANE